MAGTTAGTSRGAGRGARNTTHTPNDVRNEMKELQIRWYAFCLAPRREHVVRKVEFVVFPPVVLPEEDLHARPRGLDGVGVGPGVRIEEVDALVHSAIHATLRTEIAVRTAPITDDRSAGFDSVTYDGHQPVGGSVQHGNKKCSARFSFNTAKHPLTLNPLQTKRRLLYLKTQAVPRCKHFSSRL